MTTTPWNPELHDLAKRRAAELRDQAIDAAWKGLVRSLRRLAGKRQLPEA